MEKYIENTEYSVANIERLLNIGNEYIIGSRINDNKDKKMDFSITVLFINNNRMIVGNIGNNIVKIRNNKTGKITKVTNNVIKQMKLKSLENIVIGNYKFWKKIKELSIKDNDLYNHNSCEYLFAKLTSKKEDDSNNFLNISVQSVVNIPKLNKENNQISFKKARNNYSFTWVLMVFLCSFLMGFNLYALVQLNENRKMLTSLSKELKYFELKTKHFNDLEINNIQNNLIDMKLEKKENILNDNKDEKIFFEMNDDVNNSKNIVDTNIDNNKKIVEVTKKIKESNNPKMKLTQKLLDIDREIEENWKLLGRDKFGNEIVKLDEIEDNKNEERENEL